MAAGDVSTRRALPSPNPPRALFSRVISKITRALSAAEKGAGGPRHNASRNLAMTLASYGGLLCSAGAPLLCFFLFLRHHNQQEAGAEGMHKHACECTRGGRGLGGNRESACAKEKESESESESTHTRARAHAHTRTHTHIVITCRGLRYRSSYAEST